MTEREMLGHRLYEARQKLGLSIEDVAGRMAVSTNAVKNWESGKTAPRPNRLHILSGILGVPLLWLYAGRDEQRPIPDRQQRMQRVESNISRMSELQDQLAQLRREVAADIAELRKTEDMRSDMVA